MAKVSKSPIKLRDGFYIEVATKHSTSGIKIHRTSKAEIDHLIKTYSKSKNVTFLGEAKNGKFVTK